jgi:RNase P subunit RPR2
VQVVDRPELDAMAKSSPPPLPKPAPACVSCSKCEAALVWRKPGKLRVRVASRYLFVRLEDGVAEVTCERCGTDNDLPLRLVW